MAEEENKTTVRLGRAANPKRWEMMIDDREPKSEDAL